MPLSQLLRHSVLRPKPDRPPLRLTALEDRAVPAAPQFYLSGTILYIRGGTRPDGAPLNEHFLVLQTNSALTVYYNVGPIKPVPAQQVEIQYVYPSSSVSVWAVSRIDVDGGGGIDDIDLNSPGHQDGKGVPYDPILIRATARGGPGNDDIRGTAAADSLFGDGGNDVISGRDGNDTVDGGVGDDAVSGWNGADHLTGDDGVDTLIGGDGADWLSGDAGGDNLYGDSDRPGTTLAGNDTLFGGDGTDRLTGGDGADSLVGGDGSDWLSGDAGADRLEAGPGADVAYGGADNDTMDLGVGRDTADGGAGDDAIQTGADAATEGNHASGGT
ncbi:MAG TPA: calcium-binding protein, partial [Gemmataceae bacterium]|nr:calcium-binding protein [Gemmataceae bacterium]